MKLFNMNWNTLLYDPRKGQDFVIESESIPPFSTLKADFFTIIATVNWNDPDTKTPRDEVNLLRNCMCTPMLRHGGQVFFSSSYSTHITKKTDIVEFNHADEVNGSRLGYLDLNAGNIKRTERHRVELQTYEDWIVGSCKQPFTKPDILTPEWTWNLGTLLEQPDKINTLYYLSGETYRHIFLIRPWPGLDEWLEPIMKVKSIQ